MLKLSSACFAMRTVTSLMQTETLKLVHFPYFHSIVIWNNYWRKFNRQQTSILHPKKITRIMAAAKRRASCRELFKEFNILPLARKFLLSLPSIVVDNMEKMWN
jgi:hypothetical protein